MFQNDAVFPWRRVIGNVAAGPLFRGTARREALALALAQDWLARVGLDKFGQH